MDTWKHRHMAHGHMDTWKHRQIDAWTHGGIDMET